MTHAIIPRRRAADAGGDARPSITADSRRQVEAMRARDARGRRTMASIRAALLDLIETHSFDRITVDDIVKRAGVGRATFYRQYADKEALLEEIAREEIARLVSIGVPLADKNNSLATCREIIGYVDRHRGLWSVLLTGGAANAVRNKFIELATPHPDSLRAVPAHDIPVSLSASWGVAATVEILAWWLREPARASVEQVARYLDRLAIRPSLDPPPAYHAEM